MSFARQGRSSLLSALKVTLGAGAVLGTSYLLSRSKGKRDVEARLESLEKMVESLTAVELGSAGNRREEEH